MLFNRKSGSRGSPEREASIAPEAASTVAAPSRHPSLDATPAQSFIDASLTIVGDLHSEGDVQIDGRICGNVTCAQLIVGRDAIITGTVKAEQAIVRGSITGTICACVVILQETARVKSDIAYTLLAIDDGAAFEGAARRSESPLEETEPTSPLAELQRTIDGEKPRTAAAPSNGRDEAPRSETAPKPDRRNANGHADTHR
jgi:cytoskeletal protein CcmA (bactofilin family)